MTVHELIGELKRIEEHFHNPDLRVVVESPSGPDVTYHSIRFEIDVTARDPEHHHLVLRVS